ncbi:T9SS type A sorting domain-containing protein [Litoribacter ruber]|uniref:T9SS type A sorting domain-containing protein n=1 Tax=Litoribacter ruber TaxID=702568 RepID=UPI001BD959F7|nr:T9SS type A sorting domain-containing protein [Litoribacter ruber]MBT0809771.1 T9SS type A sorting domain-containing protein [Litoribacter ruber]
MHWDGEEWRAATRLPGREDEIYIEDKHTVRLVKDEEIGNVFIFADTGAGQKLTLNGSSLFVYGTLNAFKGTAPGEPGGTWNSQNWIGNSVESKIVFKGESRTIITRGAWSGFNTNSRYTVVFDPGEGKTLTLEEPFKSIGFTINSGKLIQTENRGVTPIRCSTFSANNEGPYGEGFVIVKNGARLISDCTRNIAFRSDNNPIGQFYIELGAELEITQNNNYLLASDLRLDGEIIYSSPNGNQRLLQNGNHPITSYHSLQFLNASSKTITDEISLTGDFYFDGEGPLLDNNTHYRLTGPQNQNIDRKGKPISALTIEKPVGEVSFNHDVAISESFHHIGGDLNFRGNKLVLEKPEYLYLSGSWKSLQSLTWNMLANDLNEANGTFPFYDLEVNGLRSLKLLGSPGVTTTPLNIKNIEIPGVNHNPGFNDNDGTPILHKLNSYYEILAAPAVMNNLTMKIRADELIVVDPDDLRIVSDTHAAPGNHQQGADIGYFLAKRDLSFDELQSQTFTIGSTGEFSVLPLTWLDFQVNYHNRMVELSWSVAKESGNEKFVILRSEGNANKFQVIGEVPSKGNYEGVRKYAFTYGENNWWDSPVYFQIQQVDFDGRSTYSEIRMLRNQEFSPNLLRVYPNPHHHGQVFMEIADASDSGTFKVFNSLGQILAQGELNRGKTDVTEKLGHLVPGLYFVELVIKSKREVVKFTKQ